MSRDSDDDLATLLSDLRVTLDELQRTLDSESGPDREGGADRRRPPSRDREPPRGSDVVRFTEEYTIPTVIAILETTVQSLELLRGVLRLADPDRRLLDPSGRDDERQFDGVDRRVVDGTERALDDLRRALSGTEEPTDPVARDVFREARNLTAEIESRIAEARDATDGSRPRRRRGDDARESVVIPVDDEADAGADEGSTDDEERGDADETDEHVEIDVEAELDSIRDEVHGESASADADEAAVDGDRIEHEGRGDDGETS